MKIETVEEFLARGGKITVLPPEDAGGLNRRIKAKQTGRRGRKGSRK